MRTGRPGGRRVRPPAMPAGSAAGEPPSSGRRLTLVLFTWLAGLGVATAVGLGALQMIGDQVTDRATRPLSEQAVDSAAASASRTTSALDTRVGAPPPAGGLTTPATTIAPNGTGPSPTTKRGDDPAGPRTTGAPGTDPGPGRNGVNTFKTEGGLILASCVSGKVVVRAAVPNNDYRSHVAASGTVRAEVEFVGADHHVRVTVTCVNGAPVANVEDGPGDDWGHGGSR